MLPTRRFTPVGLWVLAVVALLGSSALAKVAVVWIKDRQEPIKGELVAETAEKITVRIAGIDTPISRDRIDRIDYELSIADQYAQRKAEIDRDDYEARYDQIYWLYSHATAKTYKLAERELQALLEDKPDHTRAELLLDLTQEKLEALAVAAANRDQPTAGGTPGQPGQPDQPTPGPGDRPAMLTETQRELIKVYEVEPANKPRVVIPPDVINEFLAEYRTDPALADYVGREGERAFKRLEGHEQLNAMFEARARKFYDKVIIRDEPQPLVQLRQSIGPLLIARYCGDCHGGGKIKGPYIFMKRPNSEQTAYTNFIILHRMQGGERHMIDRSLPGESLLLQYALPRTEAKYLHPEVDGMKPYFTGYDDPRYQRAVQWVQSLLPSNRSYPIEYKTPQTPVQPAETPEPATGEAEADAGAEGGAE